MGESLRLAKNKQKITAKKNQLKNKYAEISAKANKVMARFSQLKAAAI